MLAGPFLPDFLPFPLSVSWSSTHNCSINISHIFYFRELLFPAQVIKTFLCRCSTFHLCLSITTSTAPYAAHWCIIRIIQKYFVAQGSFCKMLPECFQLAGKSGSSLSQAEGPEQTARALVSFSLSFLALIFKPFGKLLASPVLQT